MRELRCRRFEWWSWARGWENMAARRIFVPKTPLNISKLQLFECRRFEFLFFQMILFQHYWLFYLFVLQIYHTNAHKCCQQLLSDVSTQKIAFPSWLLLRLCCVVNKIAVGFSIIIFSRTFLFVFYLRCANCSWTSTKRHRKSKYDLFTKGV